MKSLSQSQLVDLWAILEDSREVPEVAAGDLEVAGGDGVADVGGVQCCRLLSLHLPGNQRLPPWPFLLVNW